MENFFKYPLSLKFKFFAFSPQISMRDADGREVLFIHQKVFKLKEHILVFRDKTKAETLYDINADRIIDFSAQYHFTDSKTQRYLGTIARKGWKSLWKATYFCLDANKQETHLIIEKNPWIKILDSIILEIPFVGLLSSFFFHPSYSVYQGTERSSLSREVMRLTKKSSLFELSFEIEKLDQSLSSEEEQRLLLSLLMVVQLEKQKG